MRTTKMTSKYFNISAKRTKTYTRSPPKAVIMRSATRRVAPLWARREVYLLLIMIILTQPQNEQNNMHCASEMYRINLVEQAKMSAESESVLLKSEGEMGSAQKIK